MDQPKRFCTACGAPLEFALDHFQCLRCGTSGAQQQDRAAQPRTTLKTLLAQLLAYPDPLRLEKYCFLACYTLLMLVDWIVALSAPSMARLNALLPIGHLGGFLLAQVIVSGIVGLLLQALILCALLFWRQALVKWIILGYKVFMLVVSLVMTWVMHLASISSEPWHSGALFALYIWLVTLVVRDVRNLKAAQA